MNDRLFRVIMAWSGKDAGNVYTAMIWAVSEPEAVLQTREQMVEAIDPDMHPDDRDEDFVLVDVMEINEARLNIWRRRLAAHKNNARLRNLPPMADQEARRITVGDAAKEILGEIPFDTALPQPWVNGLRDITGHDAVGHFVWAYPPEAQWGVAQPLHQEALAWLKELEAHGNKGM